MRHNLNKDWRFLKEPCAIDELEGKRFVKVDIPHTWNAFDGQDGGDDYHRGLCWYKKSFAVSEKINGRAYIEFEAVNSVANVYLNGIHLGEHRGGYSRFRYDITAHLTPGENMLLVSADNSHFEDVYPLFADFTFYGGIYRNVNLVICEQVHFDMMDFASDGVFVTQKEVSKDIARLEIKSSLVNENGDADVEVSVAIKDADGEQIAKKTQELTVKGRMQSLIEIDIINPHLWNGIMDPYLYECDVELLVEGKVMDSISIPTGLRFFEFNGDKGFFLNGKHLRLNGVSRHQDRENVGNALTQEHQVQDMKLIREVGANAIRLAHYQHNEFFYDLCDQYGMVVWAEIPYISRTSDTEDYAQNAISQMHELVRQNYNHASIIMWGIQNEIGIFPEERPLDEIVRTMNTVVKEDDMTRVTTQAQVMMVDENNPANWETDIVAFNQYHGWYVGKTSDYHEFILKFRQANPHKGMGYSEYGAEGILKWHTDDPRVRDYTEEYHAKYHEEVTTIFKKYDFIWGAYVWNMFDFGSDSRDEGGVQGRNNKGLVTFDRSAKKDAFYFYKSIWNEEPMVHITSKRFVHRHTKKIKVKVYSNLSEVSLFLNGNLVDTKKSDSTVFLFDVVLGKRKNIISAKAEDLEDAAVFIKVLRKRKHYLLPESEKKKGLTLGFDGEPNIKNWYDDSSTLPELEFPEEYFSIKDSPKAILESDEGRAYLEQNFSHMMQHPMFKRVSGISLEKLFKFLPESFPPPYVCKINKELNKIKK